MSIEKTKRRWSPQMLLKGPPTDPAWLDERGRRGWDAGSLTPQLQNPDRIMESYGASTFLPVELGCLCQRI